MVKKKKPLRISIPTKCLRGADKFIERGESLKGKPKEKTPCKVLVTWWWRAEGDVGFSGLYQPMNSGFAAGRVAVPQKIVAAYSQGKSKLSSVIDNFIQSAARIIFVGFFSINRWTR